MQVNRENTLSTTALLISVIRQVRANVASSLDYYTNTLDSSAEMNKAQPSQILRVMMSLEETSQKLPSYVINFRGSPPTKVKTTHFSSIHYTNFRYFRQ